MPSQWNGAAGTPAVSARYVGIQCHYPRESEGICFHRRWFVCVSVCLSVTTITKKIVDGFVPNFMGRFLGGKGRSSSCIVTICRGMWK